MFGKNKNDTQPDMEFFTVFDSKSKTYDPPFPCPNSEVLVRDFITAFRKPDASEKNRYYINAEDFSIFKVGNFTVKTGQLVGHALEHVANCHDLRAASNPPVMANDLPRI